MLEWLEGWLGGYDMPVLTYDHDLFSSLAKSQSQFYNRDQSFQFVLSGIERQEKCSYCGSARTDADSCASCGAPRD